MSSGVVGLESHRLVHLCNGFVVASKSAVGASEKLMRVREPRVQLYCLRGELDGLVRQLRNTEESALQIVSRAKRRPRARVVGILLGRLLEVMNCTVERVTAASAKGSPCSPSTSRRSKLPPARR